ncbi:hypothetical protein GUITHDRAFT_147365 [Guillardia theta CCMP2712]|uniref:Uncharacterized protein n=1 Tax=Guillardia theta (strain CCMP2712) TaxID=905079 RepID=L1IEI4_GUITC|nr:hypothetical protein GUITHDRAFT_147365 [Guillardia theta CCMP2712]EKX34245.1 hypothetical protein GUITHDRAFT_147365 [Guillardia theta CCMP2712]|eukprot:XP_005821225.1 hypothetical protein GUITHDRAFT_147365 [Guillardia theta CCMP2712]
MIFTISISIIIFSLAFPSSSPYSPPTSHYHLIATMVMIIISTISSSNNNGTYQVQRRCTSRRNKVKLSIVKDEKKLPFFASIPLCNVKPYRQTSITPDRPSFVVVNI